MKHFSNETNTRTAQPGWTDNGKISTVGFISFMLVGLMIKAILCERTVALCASMDLGKGLGRSEP